MSSLSDRLANLNRTTEPRPADEAQGTEPPEGAPAPKRRADVPTDHDSTPARTHTPSHAGHASSTNGSSGHGTTSGPSILGKAVGASTANQARAAATTAVRPDAAKDRFEDLK